MYVTRQDFSDHGTTARKSWRGTKFFRFAEKINALLQPGF